MIKVIYKSKKRDCFAEGEFCIEDNTLIVKKGAKLSSKQDEKFRISKAAKKREDKKLIKNNILQEDISFNSPSVAAQFVSGSSLNGLKVWKTEDKSPLKKKIEEK